MELEEHAVATRRVGTERISPGRKAVSEEPQDMTVSKEENPEPQDESAPTETSADEAAKAESEDSEADFEAHGSWGGIG
jgi:hypothetical protein